MFLGNNHLKPEFVRAFRFTQGLTISHVNPSEYCCLSYRLDAKNTTFEFGKKKISARRGDVIFAPHGLEYVRRSEADDVIVVHFTLCAPELNEIEVFTPDDPDEYRELFMKTMKYNDEGSVYAATAALYGIMDKLTRANGGGKSEEEMRIGAALRRIREEYSDPALSVSELSRECGLSEVSFRAAFVKALGIRPSEYITRYRIERCCQLLSVGGFKMEEIAEKTGFCDAKYLATVFKRVMGRSPSEFCRGER